jgi:hypothetical protein
VPHFFRNAVHDHSIFLLKSVARIDTDNAGSLLLRKDADGVEAAALPLGVGDSGPAQVM